MASETRQLRICENGHRYYKSSDCPVCPICDRQSAPSSGFLSSLSAPARRALEHEGIDTLEKLSRFSEKEILALHGMGPSTIPILRSALAKQSLTFRPMQKKASPAKDVDPSKKATGKTLAEWFKILDSQNAALLSHKEIVAILSNHIESSWWCQQVTVEYERHKGIRAVGQTSNKTFQAGVTKTLPMDHASAWQMISTPSGVETWLGKNVGDISKLPHSFETSAGISGEITVMKEGSHFRLTWKQQDWKEKSVLEVRITPKGSKSVLGFQHERLPGAEQREEMKAYWTSRIEALLTR